MAREEHCRSLRICCSSLEPERYGPEPEIQRALTAAAALREVALVEALLRNWAETCRTSKFYFGPLRIAVNYGNLDVILVLLGKGTLNASCLVEACLAGHKHLANIYLPPGRYLGYAWWKIQNLFSAAVASSKYPLVRQIISLCSITKRPGLRQGTYFEAAKHLSLEMVHKLIDLGINIRLYLYAMGGDEHAVAFLLDEGVNTDSQKKRLHDNRSMEGDRCTTALFSAAIGGKIAVRIVLKQAGAFYES
ncbi:hypothetical protein BGZ60DRAFT_551405 [Tricladium varicosporioides]|nr:hypothetical protein BGZ60DRAFT_551405 [Hymenoscyphus varicosporioides]